MGQQLRDVFLQTPIVAEDQAIAVQQVQAQLADQAAHPSEWSPACFLCLLWWECAQQRVAAQSLGHVLKDVAQDAGVEIDVTLIELEKGPLADVAEPHHLQDPGYRVHTQHLIENGVEKRRDQVGPVLVAPHSTPQGSVLVLHRFGLGGGDGLQWEGVRHRLRLRLQTDHFQHALHVNLGVHAAVLAEGDDHCGRHLPIRFLPHLCHGLQAHLQLFVAGHGHDAPWLPLGKEL